MKIVCFGDSVTRGISYVNGRLRIVRDTYPALLQRAFGTRADVVNQGVFNDNSDLLVSRLEKDVFSEHPEFVLIEIGGNDCNFRWDEVALRPEEEHEAIVPLERYVENLSKMVSGVRNTGAVPVLLNLLPLDPARYYRQLVRQYGSAIAHWIALCGGIEHWHGLYNRALQPLAESFNVLMIDIRSAFKQSGPFSDLLSDDGIHPTPLGYKAMSDAIYHQLLPHLSM